ncbi:aspartyl protease family protein [Chryseobacterium turcicum]|uniref:Aspartyl protease family protein n=1 Tax=Chryseobacterium turcicum TaxID=2898076 RepID=A0A9Q3YVW5_9FLAO|nr:aspartyl protease family protein [Chryseobacterium turcicum]MCD1117359.1 aspartyl protease family protein [Chryseobacterium turcicum]
MKKHFFFVLIFITILASAQGKRFFENGEVELKNPVEKINLTYINELPFVKVNINGKTYQFLFDTGAPTVISTSIYNELNLKRKHRSKVTDSKKNKQEQIFTEVPEIIINQITFKKIGAVVMDLKGIEFECFKIDGIIGANQMAKLFWRINYSENSIEATQDLANFPTEGYEAVWSFKPKPQKTPVIEAYILDKKINLTFDTGFTGTVRISNQEYDAKNSKGKFVETYGTASIGAFGAGKPESSYYFKPDKVFLAEQKFENEIISTGSSSLLGNEFLKKFRFIIDWENNKIYLNKIKDYPSKLESFGFAYRFVDQKAMVVLLFNGNDMPLKLDDEILSINNISLENLDKESVCNYLQNRIEKNRDSIDVKVKREGKVLDFTIAKKEYLK